MEDQEKPTRRVLSLDMVRNMNIMISVPLLIALVIGTYQVGGVAHVSYVNWHDRNYVRLEDSVTLAQAQDMQARVESVSDIARDNQRVLAKNTMTLNEIQTAMDLLSAVATVRALRDDMERKELENPRGAQWQLEHDRLIRQLEQAESVKSCILESRGNCHLLRFE